MTLIPDTIREFHTTSSIKRELKKVVNKDNRACYIHFLNAVKKPELLDKLALRIVSGIRDGHSVTEFTMFHKDTGEMIK